MLFYSKDYYKYFHLCIIKNIISNQNNLALAGALSEYTELPIKDETVKNLKLLKYDDPEVKLSFLS